MSKMTQEQKAAKAEGKILKGKQKRIAEADAKRASENPENAGPKQKTAISGIKNLGKCCTCVNYPARIHGEAQPCKKTGTYVARKCATCPVNAYKCKWQ